MPWTYKGNVLNQPGVAGVIDNSGISNVVNSNNREVVFVGSAGGGIPKQVQMFSDTDSAISALQSGNGLTAVLRALKPAKDPTVSPGSVGFVRVDPATQSTYNIVNGATTLLSLTTTGYGQYTVQTDTQVQSGSIQGLKASISQGSQSFSQDNIYAGAISVQYNGANASGLLNVTGTQISGSAGATGSESVVWTAAFASFPTVQSLVNYINAQAGWSAVIVSAPANGPTADYFDVVTSQACKTTAYTVTANLDALKNWYNNTGLVTATRTTGLTVTTVSAMTAPAYFTGGTNGTPTNTDWSNALAALQNESLARIIVVLSSDSTIHAMADAHCNAMSAANIRKNRVQIAGGALGETVTSTINRAQALNSRRTSLVWPGIQDVDPITATLTTYAPYMVAAQAAGFLSALPVVQALTHQALAAKGLEGSLQYTLQTSDYDNLTNAGVMAIKYSQSPLVGNSYVFVRSVTTWLGDTKLVNQELSMVCNEDYVDLRVADAINAYLVGNPGSPVGVGQVISIVDGELRKCYEEGSIVGDDIKSAYRNITVNLSQGAVTGGYTATIPAPMNFFGITSGFQIYNKSAQLGA